MKTKFFAILCLIVLFVAALPSASAAEATSGQWGDISWNYDDGTLYIRGNGPMEDFFSVPDRPWSHLSDSVETLCIEEGITNIADHAFFKFTNLVTVQLPDSLERIGTSAFSSCKNLTWVLDSSLQQRIPDKVHTIDLDAFAYCTSITNLVLGNNVQTIGSGAFSNCIRLVQISFSPNLEEIGDFAFYNCNQLETLFFPSSLTYIGEQSFFNGRNVGNIYFTGAAPSIYDTAFLDVNAVVHCPDSWDVSMRKNYGGALTWQTIPAGYWVAGTCGENVTWGLERNGRMTLSGTGAMYNYDTIHYPPWYNIRHCITSLVVEEGVTAIGSTAFYKCYNLKEVSLPDSVHTLEQHAFFDCQSLTEIFLGPNVTTIGDGAFISCIQMEQITVHSQNPHYCSDDRGVLYNKPKTLLIQAPGLICGNYEVPDGVTQIGDSAFSFCKQLTSISFPNSLTTIGNSAFSCCWGLTSVTIPRNVSLVKHCAFWYCQNIEQIHFLGDAPIFEEDQVFVHVNAIATYPKGNPTWTADKFVHTDSDMSWIAVDVDTPDFCIPALDNAIFDTLEEAITVYDPELHYIQLQDSVTVDTVLTKDLHIDLNGFDMTGKIVCGDYEVYGRDSSTDRYQFSQLGYFTCVDEQSVPIIPNHEYQPKVKGTILRYMTIPSEQGYSFHRYYLSIDTLSLVPAQTAFGYRAIFKGDDMVKGYVTSVGYKLWINENHVVCRDLPGFKSDLSLRLKNFDVTHYGETAVNAKVTITLPDGTVFESTPRRCSMRTMIEEINEKYQELTGDQLTALQAMLAKYPITKTWNTENLF